MKSNNTVEKIKEQCKFCKELMDRLASETKTITNDPTYKWLNIENSYRKRQDIKRIRRELQTLANMLE